MDVFDLVAKLSLDKTDYDEGLESAEKEAGGFGEKLSGAFGVATKAGAALAGGAVAAGTAIYGMATKSAATADHIDKMSQKLGLSREAYQEFDFVASQSGTSVDSMRGGLKTLAKQMTNAASGNKAATEAFKQLGLSVYDANGNLKDQETMMFETIEALQGMEDGTERASLATKLLGRSGSELTPLLNSGTGSLEAMRQQAHDLGLVLSDETIDAGVHLTDTIDQMQRAFGAIATEVGKEVMPIVQEALQFVVDHVPEIREVVSKVFGVLEQYVSWFVSSVKTYVMPTIQSIVDFVKNVFAGDWKNAWQSAREVFTNAWEGLSSFFEDMFGNVADVVQSIDWRAVGKAILDFIKSAFYDLTQWATDFYNTASEAIKSVDWVEVGNAIWDTIASAFDAIGDAFASIFQTGSDGAETGVDWEALGSAILGYVKSAFDAIGTVFTTIFNRAYTAITEDIDWKVLGENILGFVKAAFSTIGSAFKTIFDRAYSAVTDDIDWEKLGEDILGFIKAAFSTIGSAFKTIFDRAWTAIKEDVDWEGLGTTILNFITGAFEGLANGAEGVVGWFTNKFGEVIESITGLSWEGMGGEILGFIEAPFDAVEGVVKWFGDKFQVVLDTIHDLSWEDMASAVFDFIKNPFEGNALSGAVTWFQNKFQAVLSTIQNLSWESMGSAILGFIESPFDGVISGAVAWFNSKFTAVMEDIKGLSWSTVGETIWNAIKDAIANMGSIFQASNLFKLPEIRATTFDVGPFHIPDIEVVWNKKAKLNPYMFSNATLFGAGEAGDEILYGHSNLMSDIKDAVASANNSDRLYDLLYEYLPEILDSTNKEIVLDDGTLIGHIDTSLGWNSAAAARGA